MDFNRQSYGNWKFYVANHAMTENFHIVKKNSLWFFSKNIW